MKVAVCVIAKNEAPFLAEWLEYHLMMGVDRFVLYDNNSSDHTRAVCQRYADYVTVIGWPGNLNPQRAAYRHFAVNFGGQFDWTAFIDADEFIVCKNEKNLKGWLRYHEREVALMLEWRIFCTNGHLARPPGLVIENFTKAHSVAPQPNVKTICRADQIEIDDIVSPHRFSYRDGRTACRPPQSDLLIHHYILRSYEDLVMKVSRGDAWNPVHSEHNRQHVMKVVRSKLLKYDHGDLADTHMLRYVEALRGRLAARGAATD